MTDTTTNVIVYYIVLVGTYYFIYEEINHNKITEPHIKGSIGHKTILNGFILLKL